MSAERRLGRGDASDVATMLRAASQETNAAMQAVPRPKPPAERMPRGRATPAVRLALVAATVVGVVAGTVQLGQWAPTRSSTAAVRTSQSLCDETETPEVYPPGGWTGPLPGRAEGSTAPVLRGQVVLHWVGPEGALEFRWPADPAQTQPSDPSYDSVFTEDDDAGQTRRRGSLTALVEGRRPPCDQLSLAWFGGVPRGYGDGLGWLQNDVERALRAALVPGRDLALVSGQRDVIALPQDVVECPGLSPHGGDGGTVAQASPEEALQELVDSGQVPGANTVGWTMLRTGQGDLAFGVPYDSPRGGWVQLVFVDRISSGWMVSRWRTSGC